MSKALFEKLAKHFAAVSDLYEELATAGAAGTADDADVPDDDGDLPAAKAAGTKGKPKAAAAAKPAAKPAAKAKAAVVDEDPDLDDTADAGADEADADADGPTEEDVVAAAQVLIKAGLKEKAVAIIKKHGGKRVADLDADTYAAVIADFKKAGKAKPAPVDDDEI